jgi:hypothetical protein
VLIRNTFIVVEVVELLRRANHVEFHWFETEFSSSGGELNKVIMVMTG